MSVRQAIILFAHGSRNPQWREPFEAIAAQVRANAPEVRVELAFLELMSPSVDEAVRDCADSGIERIRIVPLFFGVGKHIAEDLQALVADTQQAHPHLNIQVVEAVGQSKAVRQAMADYALSSVKQYSSSD